MIEGPRHGVFLAKHPEHKDVIMAAGSFADFVQQQARGRVEIGEHGGASRKLNTFSLLQSGEHFATTLARPAMHGRTLAIKLAMRQFTSCIVSFVKKCAPIVWCNLYGKITWK